MNLDKKNKQDIETPFINETMPHQASAPIFKGSGKKMEPPFVNEHGVVIGDSFYDSENSPLNNWSEDVDPSIMSGDEWVHPTNDIGWNTEENRELVEQNIEPQGVPFTHPDKDVSYNQD
ncbi:DUF3905 domain-containing protein [Bacillus salitolerans]|uniref:DUF3905 domain-containing protein n=1 Tax=Bacillus salitolerans TaxID=1437434 RepID=A0ABW4LJX4_9BACI